MYVIAMLISLVKRNIESIEGVVVKHGTGAHITLPIDWIGKKVIVRLVK
jgi:putative transposon-encoded protein